MKNTLAWAFCFISVGFWLASFLVWALTENVLSENGGYLAAAQRDYAQCIAVGAPRENCLKTYLLPKEARP